jgi:multiple sugar transport system permease protein
MPLISRVGRGQLKSRLALGVVYLLLILGAVTTLYPFVVMGTLGLKGAIDQNDGRLIPHFLVSRPALMERWLDEKHGGDKLRIASLSLAPGREGLKEYEEWLAQLPPEAWIAGFRNGPGQVTGQLSQAWQEWLRTKYGTVEEVNRAYNELNQALPQVGPPPELLERPGWRPKPGPKREDWLAFKRQLPVSWRIPLTEQKLWTDFLQAKHRNQASLAPREVLGAAKTLDAALVTTLPEDHPHLKEFRELWKTELSKGHIWLDRKQPTPALEWEKTYVKPREGEIRWEMATRSYRYVAAFLFRDGRVLFNTALFCFLAVAAQLIVNPICAYALSRFPHRSTAGILMFLLATMAFPAEVAMIPSFLLLKELGLLNTFAALVLPAAASGFMIFLLKGFFDSLPKEIFESGQMDGAPEWLMMVKLALPLCRPVLGYLALLAFMGAYGSFMFAFLVVQKREMWTLMVMIFQMQGYAPKSVMMAALTLAALPTVIVFLAAQRTIMKGIILPGEK